MVKLGDPQSFVFADAVTKLVCLCRVFCRKFRLVRIVVHYGQHDVGRSEIWIQFDRAFCEWYRLERLTVSVIFNEHGISFERLHRRGGSFLQWGVEHVDRRKAFSEPLAHPGRGAAQRLQNAFLGIGLFKLAADDIAVSSIHCFQCDHIRRAEIRDSSGDISL